MVRLVIAVISNVIWETLIAVAVLLLLPRAGINIPLPWLAVTMAIWLVYSIITYRLGSRALRLRVVVGLVGSRGRVVRALTPEGLVKIRGELWQARADDGNLAAGKEIVVVRQDGMKLFVRPDGGADTSDTPH